MLGLRFDTYRRALGTITFLALAAASAASSRAQEPIWYVCEDNWQLRPCTNLATCQANQLPSYCALYFTPGECVTTSEFSPYCAINLSQWCGPEFDCDTGDNIGLTCGDHVDKCMGSP
jgi:hypothetical protein